MSASSRIAARASGGAARFSAIPNKAAIWDRSSVLGSGRRRDGLAIARVGSSAIIASSVRKAKKLRNADCLRASVDAARLDQPWTVRRIAALSALDNSPPSLALAWPRSLR